MSNTLIASRAASPRSPLSTTLAAGALGAFLVEIPLWATHVVTWPAGYQWIASMLLGSSAFADSNTAWLGVAIHLIVSFAWAALYVFGASRIPALRRRPLVAGPLFGLIVYAVMQAALAARGAWHEPTIDMLFVGLVDHAVFFGLPVALATARGYRTAGEAPVA